MRNFNTNQTRHFYTYGIVSGGDEALTPIYDKEGGSVIAFKFGGKNADGLAFSSDMVKLANIKNLSVTASADMKVPALQHTITIDTAAFANAAALAGKTVKLAITVHQLFDYDDSNSCVFYAEHTVAASETNAVFYAALKDAAEKAMPKPDKQYPYVTFTSSADGLVITEALQKYVRGKLTGEPVHISVAFGIVPTSYTDDVTTVWGKDTVAESTTVALPANYVLADLEYFAFGERGDFYRGFNFPNDYTPTYVIDPKSTTEYDVLNIEYFYAGDAENVQKSPRLIQIAGVPGEVKTLLSKIKGYIDPSTVTA